MLPANKIANQIQAIKLMTKKFDDIPLREHDWLEIEIDITPEAYEAVGEYLFNLGCTGLVTGDMDYKGLKGYLPPGTDAKLVKAKLLAFIETLQDLFPDMGEVKIRLSPLPHENWEQSWKKFFKKKWVTSRLLIIPAWEGIPEIGIDHDYVIMDPGPAFGTGQHPTTMMCLKALEKLIHKGDSTLLDVGTGSGILAIYAAKLGAAQILGIDNDPEAVRWAKRNVALNGLAKSINISSTPIEAIDRDFQVVVANLIMKEIVKILEHLIRATAAGGYLVLSGLLKEQTKKMEEVLRIRSLVPEQTLSMNEWSTLIVRKY